ncbi:MAG: DUF3810 domain-containing protein [Prevotellaceae bacterium]|jgi:hypothetical protein|nr:DUF3810 domain-containing protein [Prevotellaceae bacterium]
MTKTDFCFSQKKINFVPYKKEMRLSKPIKLLTAAILLFVTIFAASKMPGIAEWYVENIYPLIAAVFSFVSSLFPFSLFDVFTVAAPLALLVLIVLMILRKVKWSKGLYIIARSVLLLVAWFYFAWGFAYFRKDFYERCNIRKSEYNAENFSAFAKKFIDDANSAYIDLKSIDKDDINRKIELQYEKLKDVLKIKYPNGKRKSKRMLYESLHTKTGVSGYFGPFFNEIHVNGFVLDFEYPFTLAHEKAHQFGVASEAECNLYAFITCATGDDAQLRYSAYISTIIYVLNNYAAIFPDDYKNLLATVDSKIIEDIKTMSKHWTEARNQTLSNAQRAVYDTYLKTNRINSGIKNYSEVVNLLISSYNTLVK